MSFFDRARVISKMVFGGRGFEKTVLKFSGEELSNIKNKAMEKLQGTRYITSFSSTHKQGVVSRWIIPPFPRKLRSPSLRAKT